MPRKTTRHLHTLSDCTLAQCGSVVQPKHVIILTKDPDFGRKMALLFYAMCLYLDCVLKFGILVVEHAET